MIDSPQHTAFGPAGGSFGVGSDLNLQRRTEDVVVVKPEQVAGTDAREHERNKKTTSPAE